MTAYSADVVIVGSGIGGATMAHALADTGAKILVLERGQRLVDSPDTRNDRAIFKDGVFRTQEQWFDARGEGFNPGNFYNVGGNSKFYGAVMFRYRAQDFEPIRHVEGETPGWPVAYRELEPWYGKAEALFCVRGQVGADPTEPYHSSDYQYPPVPDEPSVAIFRDRLKKQGLHPSPLPLAVDRDAWLARAKTPWDGFPDTFTGKIDAETGPLQAALRHENVTLLPNAEVLWLETSSDGKEVTTANVRHRGEKIVVTGKTFIVAAGAVNSAILLLRSTNARHKHGLANGSDQVGRNFMNHNCTAMIAIDPRLRNDSIYQKTLCFNDFYLSDPKSGLPLGNVQLLGKISGTIFNANMKYAPAFVTNMMARRSFDWYLMSEDLPNPESRVCAEGDAIVVDWRRSNLRGHELLVNRVREVFRASGFLIVLSRAFDKKTPSHQCGTAKMGLDAARSVVDPWCRTHDIANLFVCDASVLPTSAAVNPALTIVAVAMRAAERLRVDLGCGL